jgi:hypothetical protein
VGGVTLWHIWTAVKVTLIVVSIVVRLYLRRVIKHSDDPEFWGIVSQDLTRWRPKRPRRPNE